MFSFHCNNSCLTFCDAVTGIAINRKGLSCRNTIYTVSLIVRCFIDGGSTTNFYALDQCKAFDKVNHMFFSYLMKCPIPID